MVEEINYICPKGGYCTFKKITRKVRECRKCGNYTIRIIHPLSREEFKYLQKIFDKNATNMK